MKGLGTDEKAIIEVLAHRTNAQRQQIKQQFKQMFGKDLIDELKSELTSHFEDIVLAMMMTPAEYDAYQLHDAIEGAGTKEGTLIEILCSRTNQQIDEAKKAYKTKYGKELEKALMSDTSGHFRRLVVSLSTGNRMENQPVNIDKARKDATELHEAGEKQLGTDESKFNQILCSQSYEQLRCVFAEYKNVAKKAFVESVKSEMSGDLEKGMVSIVSIVENRPLYFADRLYNSMKGAGTKDDTLIRVIVTRSEIDLVQIKAEFQKAHGKTLDAMIEDDTSGDYKKMLLAIVRGN
jgi:annexin A7/11